MDFTGLDSLFDGGFIQFDHYLFQLEIVRHKGFRDNLNFSQIFPAVLGKLGEGTTKDKIRCLN
jgi:hypothetical protein